MIGVSRLSRPATGVVHRGSAKHDRVEKAPAEWGSQFWPQPASAGFRCWPARPATSGLPHFFMRFREIADQLGCRLAGDPDLEIAGVAGMEHAGAGHLTFLANPKYGPKVKHTRASAILVPAEIPGVETAFLISSNPYLDFARALALFYQPPRPAAGGHPMAAVAASAAVGIPEAFEDHIKLMWDLL